MKLLKPLSRLTFGMKLSLAKKLLFMLRFD